AKAMNFSMRETKPAWQLCQNFLIVVVMLGGALCVAVGCPAPSSRTPTTPVEDPPAPVSSLGKQGEDPTVTGSEATVEPKKNELVEEGATVDPQPVDPQPVDPQPVQDPEVLFKNWPKPAYVLFLTGRQHGYIEPCGCTGLENQKGGLARRDTLLNGLRSRPWDVVPIDVGNQVRRFGRQPEIKFQLTVNSLQRMKYQAVGLGPDDLKLPAGELVALIAGGADESTPFVAANVVVLDRSLLPEYQVLKVGNEKIGITAVLGDSQQKVLNNDDLVLEPMVAGLKRVWPHLKAAECDIHVLLCYASLDESRALAREFPQFQVVVTAGGGGPPMFEPEVVEPGGTLLIQVGPKGMYAGVLGIFADPKERFRYQRVSLDSRFKDSNAMLAQLKVYQSELQRAGLTGLGLQSVAHPTGANFTGSQACGECHTKAYEVWKNTPHAHATDSLIRPPERQDIARHFDPECLSCHVTGWNPQKYFPYQTGYLSLEKTLAMKGSGCENCHGPGSRHVAAESGDLEVDAAQRTALRRQMQLTLDEARKNKCMQCHDLDNSPDFHDPGAFEKYWQQVRHPGKD
ncbi:MAG: multiheme c-type cytochrome, partial [Pirellulaceae bacterium]|nr:multiheme c-type cytochrome [Pirellulaceae bacterium]